MTRTVHFEREITFNDTVETKCVAASDLVDGQVYFLLAYLDEQLTLPTLEPVVYVGRNLDREEDACWFQDAASYRSGARYETSTETPDSSNPEYHAIPPNELQAVFEYDSALDNLILVSLRRSGQLRT